MAAAWGGDDFDFVRGPFNDRKRLAETIRTHGVDTVFHLGGMLSLSSENDPQQAIQVNAVGTMDVLEAARSENVQRVIFGSSIAVYGLDLPDGPVDDRCLQRPTTIYGVCKSFSEQLGLYYHRRYGLDFRGLRIPSVVAPGCQVAHHVDLQLLGHRRAAQRESLPDPRRSFHALSHRLFQGRGPGALDADPRRSEKIQTRIYNLAGCRPFYTAGDLCNRVRHHMPDADLDFEIDTRINALLGGLSKIDLDDGNARREWGWVPTFDLDAMIADFSTAFNVLHGFA